MAPTLYEQLGGEAALRPIIRTFLGRVRSDSMIGFLFRRVDPERLEQKEFEFAAQHLGADVLYTGQALQVAHRKHPIMGGHFLRRLRILEETLLEFQVPEAVRDHWLRHTAQLRAAITRDATDECRGNPPPAERGPENSPSGSELVKLRRQ